MNSNNVDPARAALRAVAQNPEATAKYLADVRRWLLQIGKNLEILAQETRVTCRDTHVEGDRFYDAFLRSRPVEWSYRTVLDDFENTMKSLDKVVYRRRVHDEMAVKTSEKRKRKALEKSRKNTPQIHSVTRNQRNRSEEETEAADTGYSGPTSIYDLDDRESA